MRLIKYVRLLIRLYSIIQALKADINVTTVTFSGGVSKQEVLARGLLLGGTLVVTSAPSASSSLLSQRQISSMSLPTGESLGGAVG